MAATQPPSSRHRSLGHQLNTIQPRFYQPENRAEAGDRGGEPRVKLTHEGLKKKKKSFIKAGSPPVWAPRGVTRRHLTINEFLNSLIEAESTPVALSHTTFSPPNLSTLGHLAFCSLCVTDERMLEILRHYPTKPFEFQPRP